jgi:tetratricopeptide (TPR) repeat protein
MTVNNEFDGVVKEFLHKDGFIFYYGDPGSFFKLLKITIIKYLKEDINKLVMVTSDTDLYGKIKRYSGKQILFICDAIFSNSFITNILTNLNTSFNNVRTIIVTSEVHRSVIALFNEFGAKNFIMKPVSINILVEKMANAIIPQSEVMIMLDDAKRYLEFGKIDQAREIAKKVLEKKSESSSANLILGDIQLYYNKNYDSAIDYYEKAHKSAVLYLDPIKKLSEAYELKGDTDKTLKYLNKLERLSPLNTQRKLHIGKINLEIGKEDVAEHYFNEAIKIAAQDAINELVILVKKIAELAEEKNPEIAVRFYNKAMEYRNNSYEVTDVDVFIRMGILYRKQGKWREAIREYEKALTVRKEDEIIFYNMAMAYAEGGEFKISASFIEKALQINGKIGEGNKTILKNILRVFVKCGKKESAEYFALKIQELDPEDIEVKNFLNSRS